MIEKKRILFVVTELGDGGAEKCLKTITDHLDYSKFEVDIFSVIYATETTISFHPSIKIIKGLPSWNILNNGIKNGTTELFFKHHILPIYDVQIAFMEGISSIITVHFGNPHAKKVAWIHSDLSITGPIIESFIHEYKMMDNILLVSEGLRNQFIHRFGESFQSKCITVYNPLDSSEISSKSNYPLDYKKQAMTLLSVGRLAPEKQYDLLIRVHKKLLDNGFIHELIIIGEGPERPKLESLITSLNVSNSCKLVGFIETPYAWIKMCDVFVSSSKVEACPLVIGESMILRKPIVSTITVGSTDLLKYRYGLLVENTKSGLYLGLRSLIESPSLRQHFIEELKHFNSLHVDIVIHQIEQLFTT